MKKNLTNLATASTNLLTGLFRAPAIFAAAFVVLICFFAAAQSNAATFTVTTIGDSGAGSLRQAVLDANGVNSNDVIVFAIPSGSCSGAGVCTITLTTTEITVINNGTLTIQGTGANRLTISGGIGTNRIFYSNAATFTLSGATLTNGNGTGANANNFGGAIYVFGGAAMLNGLNVTGNTTAGGANDGGAGATFEGGTHQILNSTFSNNQANGGSCGAIFNRAGATLTITNTTISGNTGVVFGGGICNNQSLTIRSSTITGNTSTNNIGGNGGGGIFSNGTLNLSNTIVAGNTHPNFPEINNYTTVNSNGYNLIGDSAGDAAATNVAISYQSTDIQNTLPLLDALSNYGGTVPTRRLQTGSPAIDKGSAVAGVFSDGRGVSRPYDIFATANAAGGNGADIGAFELIPTNALGWGLNNIGQVGDGTTTNPRSLPTQIAGGFTDIVAVEGGYNHALGLRASGTLLAWGFNGNGQLGDNSTTSRSSPVAVSGLTNVTATAGGNSHSLALLSNGTVMAWGNNDNGQLGDGTTTQRLTPVAVSGITNAVAVAAGESSSYALLADGSVMAWGYNFNGQLGDGTTTQRSTPVQVSGLTSGVVAIDGGGYSGYALLSDGSVRAWGFNNFGQLGDGMTTQRLTPVTPLNLTSGVVQITGGNRHAAALKADGTLLTWGDDSFGQLGDGTAGGVNSTPTAISLANVTQIKSTIGLDTYARLRDGRLFAWGYNAEGQMGNGTTNTSGCLCQATPVQVSADTGIGFFGANGQGGYAGSPLASVLTGANQFVRMGDATVNFPNVATAGTMQIRAIDPTTTGLTVPTGYTILTNASGYDFNSTAVFPGIATVCLKAPNVISAATFSMLNILHDDDGDGTLDVAASTRDYQRREVCRATTSFSPFVLAQALVPLAATVSVSGRVSVNGAGLRNAIVQLTDMQGNTRTARTSSFGYYQFNEVEVGQTYTVAVISKRFQFNPQVVSVSEDLANLDFFPIE